MTDTVILILLILIMNSFRWFDSLLGLNLLLYCLLQMTFDSNNFRFAGFGIFDYLDYF